MALSKGIKLGYFAQHQLEFLRSDESALQHLTRLAPKETEQKLRDYLGGFGFHGDKVTDACGQFSGGEKARLVLSLLVWQRPNLLLMDEPTNHLDLDMRQALTQALISFEGAIVVVSHDRHLLRSTTDDLYLVHDGQVEPFDGDLDDYQQWLVDQNRQETQANKSQQDNDNTTTSTNLSAQDKKEQKRKEAEFRQQTQPLRKKLTTLESKMDKLSQELSDIETALSDSGIYDTSRKNELSDCLSRQGVTKSALEEVEMEWMELQETLEEMTNTFEAQ